MKKTLSLILALVVVLSLCACGGRSSSAGTVNDQSGNTVQMTAKEICSVFSENSAKFYKQYQCSQITATGTVEKIDSYLKTFGSIRGMVYVISMQEGWKLIVLEADHEEVVNFSKGDKIKFTSKIDTCAHGYVEMHDIGLKGSTLTDYSTIEVIG